MQIRVLWFDEWDDRLYYIVSTRVLYLQMTLLNTTTNIRPSPGLEETFMKTDTLFITAIVNPVIRKRLATGELFFTFSASRLSSSLGLEIARDGVNVDIIVYSLSILLDCSIPGCRNPAKESGAFPPTYREQAHHSGYSFRILESSGQLG